jgi:putative PEP-CTERM system TPR-repeat lipoprotein
MMELAGLAERTGQGNEAIRWLDKARAAAGRNIQPLLALSELYMKQNNTQKALEAAKDAQAAAPSSLVALMALAKAQLATGNAGSAKSILRSMSQQAAFDAPWLTRIAALQMQGGDHESAGYSLNKALLNSPGYVPALNLQIQLDLRKGDVASAENRVNELLAKGGGNAEAQLMLGDLRMSQNRYADAVTAYRAAHARMNSGRTLMPLYDALMKSGDMRGASKLMSDWSRAHPRDGLSRHALGEAYMAMQDWPRARQVYEGLITLDARDARAYNNLANVLLQQKDALALKYAEQARALAPNVPQVNDTLGWVLVSQGQVEKGLRYLREAALRAPDDPVIKDHLNQALSRLGRRP